MSVDVVVPDLGEFADVEVIEVLVKPGDVVAVEDPLITLETEKATMDVPASAAGRISEVKVTTGDQVSAGDVIVVLAGSGAADSAEHPPHGQAEPRAAPGSGASEAPASAETGEGPTVEQPAVRLSPRTVSVPDLGDFADVEVIEVLVATGDEVELEQALITLETEKATMDVPSTVAGTVMEIRVEVGGHVNAGDEIAVIQPSTARAAAEGPAPAASEQPAQAASRTPAAAAVEAREHADHSVSERAARSPRPALPIDEASFSRAHASPSVRKLARELGVDLGSVRGSGRKGRVTADDVKAFVKRIMRDRAPSGLPSIPEIDFARFGPVEIQPLGRIQRISGPRLQASWVNVPHVTQHDEADITELESKRQSLKGEAAARGIKLTPLAFVLRACVLALGEFPQFKASLTGDGAGLVLKQYTHIGFAADTPNGLVVPVIRDADKKDVYELAEALAELSERARTGKLKADDMQGGVFTISSLGGIGGTFFTPIINAPEVAILGVSRNQWKPVWQGSEFVPRLMLPLSLSYDHRVIDGATAVRFTTRLGELLGDVERLMRAVA